MVDEIILLKVDSIAPNPLRARHSFPPQSLMQLADSIRRYGVLQPILVANTPVGYQIISGERRWRAAKLAGLEEIPAIIKDIRGAEMLLLSLLENMQKESLTVFEQAAAIQRLEEEFKMPREEIARSLGLTVEEVEKRLQLLNLSDKVKNEILSRRLSDREALALVGEGEEKEIYAQVLKKTKAF